jgi:signal peptidase I
MSWLKLIKPINLQSTNVGIFFRIPFALFIILYKNSVLYVNEINSIPGSYAYYLWEDKYDFLELLEIVIKGAKRYLFFINKQNAAIQKEYIFEGLNNY